MADYNPLVVTDSDTEEVAALRLALLLAVTVIANYEVEVRHAIALGMASPKLCQGIIYQDAKNSVLRAAGYKSMEEESS